MTDKKPIVLLYELQGIGIIIPWPSGVVYQNQTGGYACYQHQLEGIFVPLEGESADFYQKLYEFFFHGKWAGWCDDGIDEETAQFIEQTLRLNPDYEGIRVDRAKLEESHEAWVHVAVEDPSSIGVLGGFEPFEAILTWPNSD